MSRERRCRPKAVLYNKLLQRSCGLCLDASPGLSFLACFSDAAASVSGAFVYFRGSGCPRSVLSAMRRSRPLFVGSGCPHGKSYTGTGWCTGNGRPQVRPDPINFQSVLTLIDLGDVSSSAPEDSPSGRRKRRAGPRHRNSCCHGSTSTCTALNRPALSQHGYIE